MGDQVEVQGPGGVLLSARPTELRLKRQKRSQRVGGRQASLDKRNPVAIFVFVRLRPGGGPPPGRPGHDRQSRLGETSERSFEQSFGRTEIAGKISAQRDDDQTVRRGPPSAPFMDFRFQ